MENFEQVLDGSARLLFEADRLSDAAELETVGGIDEASEAEGGNGSVSVQENDAFKLYLGEVRKTKLLTAKEEKELALKVEQGDRAARDRMITCNLRLVVKISKRYLNRGLPFLDLIEEGNLGLIRAVERFQISRGYRFSTYATWWIRQGIERALMNQGRTIRLPVHIAEEVRKIYRVTRGFSKRMNREPTLSEVAETMNVDLSHVRRLKALMLRTYSIDQPMGECGNFFLSDTIEDISEVSPEDGIDSRNAYQHVCRLMETLSDAERKVLRLRFGLDDEAPQTLETIGRDFGVTRERIRQIEVASLSKLRTLLADRQPPHLHPPATC